MRGDIKSPYRLVQQGDTLFAFERGSRQGVRSTRGRTKHTPVLQTNALSFNGRTLPQLARPARYPPPPALEACSVWIRLQICQLVMLTRPQELYISHRHWLQDKMSNLINSRSHHLPSVCNGKYFFIYLRSATENICLCQRCNG